MHKYVIPVCGCVAVMMTFADEAFARERSHRHHWTSKHSHHSWRGHATSYRAHRWRSTRQHVAWAQPHAPMVAQSVEGPFMWQPPQPMVVPVVRQRRGQRMAATPGAWPSPTVQPSAMAVAPQQPMQDPYAPSYGWQAPVQQPSVAPVGRQRRGQRMVATPSAWPSPTVQPSAVAVAPRQPMPDPYAPSYGWQAPVQQPSVAPVGRRRVAHTAPNQAQFASLVSSHAQANGVPESLVHRVIMRESRYNPRAVSKGNFGIMQIRLGTARAMGYTGSAAGLLDANTNMTYAVRYLAGAYRAAGGNHNRAVGYYAGGYYYAAKRQGFSPYAMQARAAAPAAAPAPAMVQPVRAEVF